ncbi:MAG: isoprenoid biosynthesis glyoxalase ElbB [Candidatus Marinimicrobia bacterium]|nr:isoprenoid biosynthesis glyoxalase ElbB [Candidatus Neomarinimicrobiota bacterium]MBL7013448.1 isoprenoid biosynthesis glyoxalase ElbB [Candidatus Neomarinimicrobiota bacterium]
MAKVGVVLSGCGFQDGAEIHESVLTLLALDRAGADVQIMAPDMNQFHVVNHLDGSEIETSRNILIESARIARGNIVDVATVSGSELDALIFPGGNGMAKNIFDYIMSGPECEVIPDVYNLTAEMLIAGKPIGAICIAPVMMAKVLQNLGKTGQLTGGCNEGISADMVEMGVTAVQAGHGDIVVDEENKIVSTPAYVEASSIKEAAEGIEKLVMKVLEMAG